jgi:tRNA modification GTPase
MEGVRRARHAAENADIRIHLVDATQGGRMPTPLFEDELLVFNKIDIAGDQPVPSGSICISCLRGDGMEELVGAIVAKATGSSKGEAAPDGHAINTRHQDCLHRAASALEAAVVLLGAGEPPELVAVELRSALGAVGEVVGEAGTEEILGKIFSSFCIGK